MSVRKRVFDVWSDLVTTSTLDFFVISVISVPLIAGAFALYNGLVDPSSVILFLLGSATLALVPRLTLPRIWLFIKGSGFEDLYKVLPTLSILSKWAGLLILWRILPRRVWMEDFPRVFFPRLIVQVLEVSELDSVEMIRTIRSGPNN